MPKQSTPTRKTPAKGGNGSSASKNSKTVKPAAKAPAKDAKASAKAPAKTGSPGKTAGKAPVPPTAKPPSKAPAAKPAVNAKGGKAVAPNAGAKPAAAGAKPGAAVDAGKGGRKGITIVDNKPVKKGKKEGTVIPSFGGGLLRPGGPARKPLIQSGPHAPAAKAWKTPADGAAEHAAGKSPFNKKELARFREILVKKRSQLVGDVSNMEDEALRSGSGSLSNLPQHMADQGSDAYDQALSLDIAAADRRLIKEIDDAIARIDNGTYGVCQLTGKPIRAERLEELPWARYSIEAARELERRPNRM